MVNEKNVSCYSFDLQNELFPIFSLADAFG